MCAILTTNLEQNGLNPQLDTNWCGAADILPGDVEYFLVRNELTVRRTPARMGVC